MKRLLLPVLAAMTLMGCVTGPGYHDRDDRNYRRRERYEMEHIQRLSDRLASAANYAYRQASMYAGRPDRNERAALSALYRLDEMARRFRFEVQGRDPRFSRSEFDRLVRAYRETGSRLRLLRGANEVYRAFDAVGNALQQMAPYYGYGGGRYGDGSGYGWR